MSWAAFFLPSDLAPVHAASGKAYVDLAGGAMKIPSRSVVHTSDGLLLLF